MSERETMSTQSINPRTGQAFGPIFAETNAAEIASLIEKAQAGFELWSTATVAQRVEALDRKSVV